MDTSYIISKMNSFMFRLGQQIGTWLSPKLPRITEDWWQELVLRNLTPLQLEAVARKNIQEITGLEKNALDLALMGEIYYQKGKQQSIGEFFTKGILHNYPHSMGNGLYFLPYKIDKNQKIFCIHAVWNEDEKIGMLPSCVDGTFNYFGQNWYDEIMTDMKNIKILFKN